jgi:hypothetical protein
MAGKRAQLELGGYECFDETNWTPSVVCRLCRDGSDEIQSFFRNEFHQFFNDRMTPNISETESSKWTHAITSEGHRALVPRNAREHDLVCVLFGFPRPFILRPAAPGYFSVIGECYVHRIMDVESGYSKRNLRKEVRQIVLNAYGHGTDDIAGVHR